MRFVEDLGPTAQMVANKKLAKYLQIEASNSQQSQTPTLLAKTPNCLTRAPAYLDGAYRGKMACIDSTSLRDTVPSSDIMGTCGNLQRENAYVNNIKDVKIGSSGQIVASSARANMDIYGHSKGKMIRTDDNMDLHGTGRYDTNQNQNRPIWLGAHFPLIGNGNTNMCSKYKTTDMMAESRQLCKQAQPVQLAAELESRLLGLMSRSNNYSDTSSLPPQATKLLGQATTSMHGGSQKQNEGGANSAQAGQSLKWSRPTIQQAICDFPNVQMQLNKDKLFGQASHLVTAHKMALLHAMSFYERATPESHQVEEASAQCFPDIQGQPLTDTKKLDLALQL